MRLFLCIFAIALLSGCATLPGNGDDRNFTVGTAQREIHVGMSGAEVAESMGSPNIVSTDEHRNEVWIYDKISSHTAQTDSSAGVAILRLISDIGPIAASTRQRSNSSSQRTLTVIIKFDDSDKVRDFAYHTSRF